MSTVTIQVSPLKTALVVAGVAALILGGLTLHIADVAKNTMFLSGVEKFLYSFLTFGVKPIWLAEIRDFAYFWFGLGTVLSLVGLFAKILPSEEQHANQADYREELINSLSPKEKQALNDDIFRDIGNTVKSMFTPVKSVPVVNTAPERIEPQIKSDQK
jgi:hypothetical protein